MTKKHKLLSSIIFGLLVPVITFAVTFTDPTIDPKTGEGYFVNLGAQNTFGGLLMAIIQAGLGLVGILSVWFIIYGGFQYITSRGNEEQAEGGKKTLTNAIIGLVIVILSYIIVTVIINALDKLK
jgi:hypothetical protein